MMVSVVSIIMVKVVLSAMVSVVSIIMVKVVLSAMANAALITMVRAVLSAMAIVALAAKAAVMTSVATKTEALRIKMAIAMVSKIVVRAAETITARAAVIWMAA